MRHYICTMVQRFRIKVTKRFDVDNDVHCKIINGTLSQFDAFVFGKYLLTHYDAAIYNVENMRMVDRFGVPFLLSSYLPLSLSISFRRCSCEK